MFILPHLKGLLSGNLGSAAFKGAGLDLKFAANKSLVDSISGNNLVTFARADTVANSATYVGSDGLLKTATTNEPRFDHNPTTGESLGLLVEEARTNLVRNNTMVGAVAGSPGTPPTNGWVITNNATYTSSIIGTGIENGINYIDIQYVIAAGAAASGGIIYADTPAGSPSTAYTGSYYLKLVSGTSPQARFVWQDNVSTYNRTLFDLTSTLTRYTDTLTTAAGAALARFALGFAASPSGATFVIRVGLPQTEQGAFATSVIPTTSATVTRAADVASITGSNFSSWYNQTEGTVFADAISPATSTAIFAISDGSTNNRIQIETGGSNRRYRITSSGTARYDNTVSYTFNTSGKSSCGYSALSSNHATNGVLASDAATSPLPVVDRLFIGANAAGALYNNGTIKRLTYWPTRLSNTTLQQITQ